MDLLLEGIKFGLILTILIGPIFFSLIQVGVEEGLGAGVMVGLGVWVSDVLYIMAVYFGLSQLRMAIESSNFALNMGIGGSILLTIFGLSTIFSKPKIPFEQQAAEAQRSSSFWSLFAKGFLVNSVNPFTVFFWSSLMGTYLAKSNFSGQDAMIVFGGVVGTIVVTDTLKVVLAKKIRRFLRPVHLIWLRRSSGLALIGFAVLLLVRVLWR
jgi:threonine/homoserine/homoserine lactone efflux protein